MDKTKVKELLNFTKSKKSEIEGDIDEIFKLIAPEKTFFDDSATPDTSFIFDTNAKASINTLTTNVLSHFVPVGKEWVRLKASEKYLNTLKEGFIPSNVNDEDATPKEVLEALQSQTRKFFNEIDKSNFSLVMAELIENLALTGICTVGLEWRDSGLYLISYPWQQVYVIESFNNKINHTFVEHNLSAQTIKNKWSNPEEKYSELFLKEINEVPNKKFKIIEQFYELNTWDKNYSATKPYMYYVWLQDQNDLILLEKAQTRQPRIVTARWKRTTNNPYGVGPSHQALPDIKSLNTLSKYHLEGSEYRLKPPILTSDANLRDREIEAGTFVYTDYPDFKPLVFSDVASINQDMQALVANIKRAYHDLTLPPVADSHGMTATEISVRQNQFFTSLGWTAVTLEEELLKPLVRSMVSILQDNNILDNTINYGPEFEADFEFFSIVRASKDSESVTRDLNAIQQISIFGPEVVSSLIDIPKFASNLLSRMNFSVQFIKDDETQKAEQLQKMNAQAGAAAVDILAPNLNKAGQDQNIGNILGMFGSQIQQQ